MSEISISELLGKAEKEGAQFITRRGVETAVVIPIEEWKRLSAQPTLNKLLLSRYFLFDDLKKMIPPRGNLRRRKTLDLE